MTRAEFIAQLRRALAGMAPKEIDDIVADYSAHFDERVAAGRSEQDVASALGDPQRLARELRAEAGLRRWETQRTPAALIGAMMSLGGMLALDIFILLPLLFAFGGFVFVMGILPFAGSLAGLGLLLSGLLHWDNVSTVAIVASRMLAGIGLLGGSLGGGALLWLVRASGSADLLKVDIMGSGAALLAQLAVRSTKIFIAGSGDADIAPIDDADIFIAGSGDVRLHTHPKHLNSKIAGSGRIIELSGEQRT
jgi:uncharacterized membrane protein